MKGKKKRALKWPPCSQSYERWPLLLGQVAPIPHVVFVVAFMKAKQNQTKQKAGQAGPAHRPGTGAAWRTRGVLGGGRGGPGTRRGAESTRPACLRP